MIVGTAGHIDHGKTTLVHALTGVDTDRLVEEKRRGISIELGYAFLDAPGDQRIGFVDVPGHERLVHTMVAGATGVDFALLLVAADDGVMPQTREHLAVLALLGVPAGAVVLTKIDRVDDARLAQVRDQVTELVQGTLLQGAAVCAVSARSGQGVEALKALLFEQAARAATHPRIEDGFRMAVDRAFTLEGVGTVVTGTVHAGQVRVGDELRIVPGARSARVRSLHAQSRAATLAWAGQRCALALSGLARDEVERGAWVVAPPVAMTTDRLDLRLTLWRDEPHPLRSGQRVQCHVGAASTMASVAVLDAAMLSPGQTGLVQLVLAQPLGAWWGDRVLLRDASATRTVGGGTVLDPLGPRRYRRTEERLQALRSLAEPDPHLRAARVLAAAPHGLNATMHQAAQGRAVQWPADALAHGDMVLSSAHAELHRQRLLQVLARFHEREPDSLGPDTARLRRMALPRLHESLYQALLRELLAQDRVRQRGACVHLPEHAATLSAAEARVSQSVMPHLMEAGFQGAWVRDLAELTGESEALLRVTLSRMARQGQLHQVVRDLFFDDEVMNELGRLARGLVVGPAGELTASRFRDATGLGRKRAIQILEHLDRIGLLRRVGDAHRLRHDSILFADIARAAKDS